MPLKTTLMCLLVGAGVVNAQVQLNIQPGVQLGWPTPNTTNTYHLQWSPISGGAWSDLVAPATGNGSTRTNFDPFPSGSRQYQDLEIVPGTPPSSAAPANAGFESGSGGSASSWTVDTVAGGPVYGVRTNDSPHSGSFNFQIHLASTGAGPVVQFNQSGVPVTGGTVYPFTFYAKALAGSLGYNAQWRILWSPSGDTGYQTFNLTAASTYALISNSVIAPASATSATIFFHFAGAADPGQSANIDIDDVTFGSGNSSPGSPDITNVLQVAILPLATVSWPSTSGVPYFPESATNLTASWDTNFPVIVGDGGTKSFTAPMTNDTMFFHLRIPPVVVLPPTGLHTVISGTTNAIGLAWTASASFGVTGYRVLYGDITGTTTNSTDLGLLTSTVISGLTSGEIYFVSVVTLSPNGQSNPADATITAQPDTSISIVPLYDISTPLEPETVINTPTALITWLADRPRARHAREDMFMLYDTYLPFYWEQRMSNIEIIDTVGKGGSDITFSFWALTALNTPNIRFFFQGQTTVAQYSDNLFANQVDPTLTNWTSTINYNTTFNRPIQVGDRIEFEWSPFMVAPTNGQANYYGGAVLYMVGQGIVPWQEGVTNDPASVNAAIDSTPMPTNGWLAGGATMPYQYCGQPDKAFEQMAPNAAPASGQLFMLGRRLHHTDFLSGAHSEPDNPIFTNHVGQAGPMYIQTSCMGCHINNGRGLPPAVGQPLSTALIEVGSDADGAPDPVYGSVLLMQNVNGPSEGTATIASYTITTNTYGDGTVYTLQKPNYAFSPHTPAFFSVRFARPLVGLGLLEAIRESDILALADPSDADHDGVAGCIQTATDPWTGQPRLGRFGYKAAGFSVEHFVCAALNLELGVTTPIFPHLFNGPDPFGPPEVTADEANQWTRYLSALGVNARRDLRNSATLHGEQLFITADCAKCHTPTFTTSPYHPMAELRNQIIHPYSDLLLHDLGPGLADNLNQGNASGAQWRTSPLWSIGLTAGVAGGEAYLHDGRARTLEEAILWHGGEAEASKEAFRTMSASDRTALIAFLKSL
ncbi:MAG TPA: di-heme oxidoredictase family protein [Verrucomicrobiae bacterium]|nr:di-heme oxidoredictase family protein [Verrucomicrobiae bacterium]